MVPQPFFPQTKTPQLPRNLKVVGLGCGLTEVVLLYDTNCFPSSNYNRASNVAGRVCGNQLLERLMSPSPKSQVMFASACVRSRSYKVDYTLIVLVFSRRLEAIISICSY